MLEPFLTVTDADNTTLASATVSITSGLFAGDALNFTNQNGITGSYSSSTGILTLTGSASIANYQTALRSITFSSASDNPTNFGNDITRIVTWQVNDGAANSTAATTTLIVAAVNDAPVVTAGATVGFTEQGTAAVLNFDPDGNRCRQPDAGGRHGIDRGFLTGDTLNFVNNGTTEGNIAGSYDTSTGILTLTSSGATATVAQWQNTLHSVTFSSTSDNPTDFGVDTSRTISWTANDGALDSTAATSTLNITAVNDAPVVTASATVGYTELGTAVVLNSNLTVSDADNTTLASATVSIGGFFAGDRLNFTDQNGITGSYNGTTGILPLPAAPRSPTTRRRCSQSPTPRPATIRPTSAWIQAVRSIGG